MMESITSELIQTHPDSQTMIKFSACFADNTVDLYSVGKSDQSPF